MKLKRCSICSGDLVGISEREAKYYQDRGRCQVCDELRDSMAMAALTGMLAFPGHPDLGRFNAASDKDVAAVAYQYAAAMLAEREKKPSGIYKDEEGDKTGMAHRYCDACGKMIGAPGGCEGHSPLEREKGSKE